MAGHLISSLSHFQGEGGTFALFQGLYPPQGSMTSVSMSGEYMTKDSITVYGEQSSSTISRRWRIPLLVWVSIRLMSFYPRYPDISPVSIWDKPDPRRWDLYTCRLGHKCCRGHCCREAVYLIECYPHLNCKFSFMVLNSNGCLTNLVQAFLVVFFLVQSRGTSQLGYTFAPGTSVIIFESSEKIHRHLSVLAMWLILIAVTGIINITEYPGVFRAFDPSRAVMRRFISSALGFRWTNRFVCHCSVCTHEGL